MNDNNHLRSTNRRVGSAILAAMMIMAALTAIYAYSTVGFRRQVDAVQPEPRPLRRDLAIVGLLFAGTASVGAVAYWRWRRGSTD